MKIELELDGIYERMKETIIEVTWNNLHLGRATTEADIKKMTRFPEKVIKAAIDEMVTKGLVKRV